MRVRDLLERYSLLMNLSDRSVQLYRHSIAKFEEFLGRPAEVADLEDVTVAKFLRWRATNKRGAKPISVHSVAKDRSQLLALWNWACRKKLHPGEWPGLPRQRRIRKTPVAYTVEDVAKLVRQARKRRGRMGDLPAAWWWSTLLQALWQTGERCGAMLQVCWADVDTTGCRITFRAETRKGKLADAVRAITPELAAELNQRRRPEDHRVWPLPGHPLSIYPSLRILCRTAGVTPRGFHGIRRASASYVAAGGGDATAHLGHADPSMTRGHYLDPRITETRTGLDFLPPLDLSPKPAAPPPPST
jgi:integrase